MTSFLGSLVLLLLLLLVKVEAIPAAAGAVPLRVTGIPAEVIMLLAVGVVAAAVATATPVLPFRCAPPEAGDAAAFAVDEEVAFVARLDVAVVAFPLAAAAPVGVVADLVMVVLIPPIGLAVATEPSKLGRLDGSGGIPTIPDMAGTA